MIINHGIRFARVAYQQIIDHHLFCFPHQCFQMSPQSHNDQFILALKVIVIKGIFSTIIINHGIRFARVADQQIAICFAFLHWVISNVPSKSPCHQNHQSWYQVC